MYYTVLYIIVNKDIVHSNQLTKHWKFNFVWLFELHYSLVCIPVFSVVSVVFQLLVAL